MAKASTQGITVSVACRYLESHSEPENHRFVFVYAVTIENNGNEAAKLESRHWIITDASGGCEEVKGPGVIGETPRIEPGAHHSYQSFSVLRTPRGTMHGSYQMVRDNGDTFDAEIPTFVLSTFDAKADLSLN